MVNRLAQSSSPYLLQHQNNPVDWYPWGAEALEKARREDKPIFLSIGYSACHWCHVMEHESFENPQIAAILNDNFVAIKVDREERPDLDHIYMQAVQMMTGSGGWPMSMFLTPDQKPFYGGTYWPPTNRYGRPGFDQVLGAVINAWQTKRDQVIQQSLEMTQHLEESFRVSTETTAISESLLDAASTWLVRHFDAQYGGFGGAPKFPHAMDLSLLLQLWSRKRDENMLTVVTHSLDRMAAGGIYDHLGGGFARYSVDERWLVPHFEKMLYDNGLLISLYIDAHVATGDLGYRQVAEESLRYIQRDMTSPEGGFYSAEDADSEGEEGKFYVWSRSEIIDVLGPQRGEQFCAVYDVTQAGNFEGHNILNLPKSIRQFAKLHSVDETVLRSELQEDRQRLLKVRSRRIRPGLDDKVLVSWNALMIDAMARAYQCFGVKDYLDAACKCAQFIHDQMRDHRGRLLHTWRRGKASLNAYLDDYTYLANALLTLYEADFDERWIEWCAELLSICEEYFGDEAGGYFFTAADHESLITRVKDSHDGSVPSGNAMAALALVRLSKLSGESKWLDRAERLLEALAPQMQRVPQATAQALRAVDLWLQPSRQVACVGALNDGLIKETLSLRSSNYLPYTQFAVRAAVESSGVLQSLWFGKSATGQARVYICENQTCQAPLDDFESVAVTLRVTKANRE